MEFRGQYAFLSNFYPCIIRVKGLEFGNAEAAFQACKFTDLAARQQFCRLDGKAAKQLGRKIKLRADWADIKLAVMASIVTYKFGSANPTLVPMLLSIREPIVEDNNWGDTYWGMCSGVGENHLGKILNARKAKLLFDNLA